MSLGKRCHLGSMFLWKFEFHFDCNHWPRRDFVGHGLDGAEQLRRAGTVQVRCFHRFLLGANMTVFRNFPYSKSKPARIWSNIHQHLTYILRKHRRGSVTWNASKTTRRSSPDGWLVPPLRAPPRPTKTARRGMSGFSFVKFALPGLKSPFFTHVWHILIFMYIYIFILYVIYFYPLMLNIWIMLKKNSRNLLRSTLWGIMFKKRIDNCFSNLNITGLNRGFCLRLKEWPNFPTSTEMRHLICEVQVKLQCCQVNSPKLVIDKFGCLSFSLLFVGAIHWHANDFWCCPWYTA